MKISSVNHAINILCAPILLWIYHVVLRGPQKIRQIGSVDGIFLICMHVLWGGYLVEYLYPNSPFLIEYLTTGQLKGIVALNAIALMIIGNKYMNEYSQRKHEEFWDDVRKIAQKNKNSDISVGETLRSASFILDSSILSFIFYIIAAALVLIPAGTFLIGWTTNSEISYVPNILMILIGAIFLLILKSTTEKLEDEDNLKKAVHIHHSSKKFFKLFKRFDRDDLDI